MSMTGWETYAEGCRPAQSEIRKAEREIQSSKDLTLNQKRRALENADKLTVNFARAALGKGAVK